ncbi:putative aminohydrolase SsnA [Candidatus Riflebacteria bacterium]
MSTILIKNGIIATLGERGEVLYDHALLIEDQVIKKIGRNDEFTGQYDQVIDARNKLVLPGFINAHMHFYSTFARGLGKAKPAKNFQEVLDNLWWRLDKQLTLDDSYYSALLPLIDGIKRGTTTFIDHHASPNHITGSLDQIAKAVKQSGLRASLCYELSDRDGEKIAREGIEENVAFIKRCQAEKDDQLKAMFGLHASFTIEDKTLEQAAELGNSLSSGFHVHTAEAASDEEYNCKHFGIRVVERFKKYKILGPRTILVHCVHIDDNELDLIKESDSIVVHNPQSNMNNAVGVMDLLKFSNKGVLVGLGTDAMTVNMLEELRSCMWAHHLSQEDPNCAFMEVANTLLVNNARIADRYWEGLGLGSLNEGHVADVILMDYCSPTPLDANSLFGHMIFGVSQSFVDTTIASGKVLMQNKQLKIDVDEAEIARKSLELSTELWERF